MRGRTIRMVVLTTTLAATGAATAADLPYRTRYAPRDHVIYAPRGPAPVSGYVPPYRVIYQVPSDECARNDFCPAAL